MSAVLLALVVAETVAIALLGVLVAGLLRSHGEVLRTLHTLGAGLEPGSGDHPVGGGPVGGAVAIALTPATDRRAGVPAARLTGVTLTADAVSWAVAGTGRDTLLAFLSGGCETCQPFWTAFGAGVEVPGGADLVVVTGGPERESETLLRRLAPADLPLVMSTAAWEDYEVPGSPHFVYVDGRSGTVVGEGTAPGWPQVAALLDRAVGDARQDLRRRSHRPRRSRPSSDRPPDASGADAPGRVDAALAAAGITPGHPSLYADPHGTPAEPPPPGRDGT